MSSGYDEEVRTLLATYPPKRPLTSVLPLRVDIGVNPETAVDEAMDALRRYGELDNPRWAETIHDVAYWLKKGKPASTLPKSFMRRLHERVALHNARTILIGAFERLTLKLGRSRLFVLELMEFEEVALRAAAGWLDWGDWNPKSLGHLLGRISLGVGEPGPGIQRAKRGKHGSRWELIRDEVRWESP